MSDGLGPWRKRGFVPHSCSSSGVAPVGMGFAFAAAMDSDKRLFPPMVVYDVAEISEARSSTVSRRDDDDEYNYTSDASMPDSTRPDSLWAGRYGRWWQN